MGRCHHLSLCLTSTLQLPGQTQVMRQLSVLHLCLHLQRQQHISVYRSCQLWRQVSTQQLVMPVST